MASVYSMTPRLKGFVDRLYDLSYLGLVSVCSVSVREPRYGSQSIWLYPAQDWVSFADIDISAIMTAARAYNLRVSFISENDFPIIRISDYRVKFYLL